jgi:hypothetical protein
VFFYKTTCHIADPWDFTSHPSISPNKEQAGIEERTIGNLSPRFLRCLSIFKSLLPLIFLYKNKASVTNRVRCVRDTEITWAEARCGAGSEPSSPSTAIPDDLWIKQVFDSAFFSRLPMLAFCGVVGNFGEVNEQPSSILIVEVEGDGEEKG